MRTRCPWTRVRCEQCLHLWPRERTSNTTREHGFRQHHLHRNWDSLVLSLALPIPSLNWLRTRTIRSAPPQLELTTLCNLFLPSLLKLVSGPGPVARLAGVSFQALKSSRSTQVRAHVSAAGSFPAWGDNQSMFLSLSLSLFPFFSLQDQWKHVIQ